MKYALAIILAFGISGCDDPFDNDHYPETATNQQKRQELFLACLKAVPAGPRTTRYNDWNEVVDSCNSAAYQQAQYCVKNCPPAEGAKP